MKSKNLYERKYKIKIQVIFVYYCSYADKDNYYSLKSNNFYKMLQHLHVKCNLANSDILFYTNDGNHKLIKFQQFQQLLAKVAHLQYPSINQESSNILLFKEHLQPLNQQIRTLTTFGNSLKAVNKQVYNSISFNVLQKVKSSLKYLYNNYFLGDQLSDNRLQIFANLCKMQVQLQLTPFIINKSISYLWFINLLQEQSQSAYICLFEEQINQKQSEFTFFKFIKYLISCSKMLNDNYESDAHRINNLLQLIYITEGYKSIQKRYPEMNLIISEKIIYHLSNINDKFKVSTTIKSQFNIVQFIKIFIWIGNQEQTILKKQMSIIKFKKLIQFLVPNNKNMFRQQLSKRNKKAINFTYFLYLIRIISNKYSLDEKKIFQKLKQLSQYPITNINNDDLYHKINQLHLQYLQTLFKLYSKQNKISLNLYFKLLSQYFIFPKCINNQQIIYNYFIHCKKEYKLELILEYNQFLNSLISLSIIITNQLDEDHFTKLINTMQKVSYLQSTSQKNMINNI